MKLSAGMAEHTDKEAALAVARLYHAWITGLVLTLVTRKSPTLAAEFVFRLFRTQHLERFLPGLEKLGLQNEPHAVAAAKYHYFSNQLGGVKVEYLEESARKAWVRYPPPRWIWAGTAICAVPDVVNHAMLRGWHAHNGVSLNNPRLGFVCTKTTVAGQPGLEGYYLEYDHDLAPEERLRFAPDEDCPRIEAADLPRLDVAAWPAARQAKAYRNYAMEYIRNGLPLFVDLLGPEEGRRLGDLCGRQIGMQCYDDVAHRLHVTDNDAAAFLALLESLLRASGDDVVHRDGILMRNAWRLFDRGETDTVVGEIWRAPFVGLLAVHDRFLRLAQPGGDRFVIETIQGTKHDQQPY